MVHIDQQLNYVLNRPLEMPYNSTIISLLSLFYYHILIKSLRMSGPFEILISEYSALISGHVKLLLTITRNNSDQKPSFFKNTHNSNNL